MDVGPAQRYAASISKIRHVAALVDGLYKVFQKTLLSRDQETYTTQI